MLKKLNYDCMYTKDDRGGDCNLRVLISIQALKIDIMLLYFHPMYFYATLFLWQPTQLFMST